MRTSGYFSCHFADRSNPFAGVAEVEGHEVFCCLANSRRLWELICPDGLVLLLFALRRCAGGAVVGEGRLRGAGDPKVSRRSGAAARHCASDLTAATVGAGLLAELFDGRGFSPWPKDFYNAVGCDPMIVAYLTGRNATRLWTRAEREAFSLFAVSLFSFLQAGRVNRI